MKTYSTYKDSGQLWLGPIPEHWETRRLKHTLSRNDNGVWGLDLPEGQVGTVVLRSTEQTVDGEWRIEEPAQRLLTKAEVASAKLLAGDMLITKSSGSELHIGKTSIVTEEIALMGCCFSNFMQRLRVKPDADPRFIRYVINGSLGRAQFVFNSNSTIGLANLNGDIIGNVFTAIPPAAEQAGIVAYLDRKTADIERFISKKRQLIALLNEQKAAMINRAVTKGLNPDVPMKASGVEWLGEVPAHWEVVRAKYLFHEINDRTAEGESGRHLSMSQKSGLVDQAAVGDRPAATDTQEGFKRCSIGDLVLNKLKSHLGVFAVANMDGLVSPDYAVYQLTTSGNVHYFERLFKTKLYIAAFTKAARGIVIGFMRLYTPDFFNIPCLCPPAAEQKAMMHFIDVEVDKANQVIAKTEREIELINEYRTTLISDAVTGKIDVRE